MAWQIPPSIIDSAATLKVTQRPAYTSAIVCRFQYNPDLIYRRTSELRYIANTLRDKENGGMSAESETTRIKG